MTVIQAPPNEAQIMARTREFVRGCIEDVFGQEASSKQIEHVARPIANLVASVWRSEIAMRALGTIDDQEAKD